MEFEIEEGVLLRYTGNEETVMIPETVTAIGRYAFHANQRLKHVFIPDTVTEIGSHAFSACTALEDADIPGSVRLIAAHAFMRCANLRAVTLHEGLREIGTWAFGDCADLKSISIPSTVAEIGQFALGFKEASYEDRYICGMYHSFYSGFHLQANGNRAAEKYIAQHKLTLRMIRS